MKTLLLIFVMLIAFSGCNNNSSFTGVNNNDTVELRDEFGRDAYPEIRIDTPASDTEMLDKTRK